jgi:GTP cyclohydrolase II
LKLAGLLPAAVAPLEARAGAGALAREAGLLTVSTEAILHYPDQAAAALTYVTAAEVPLAGAEKTRIVAFRPGDGGPESLAIIVGTPDLAGPVLVRLHSECFTGDLLGSLKCDCGEQLKGAIRRMAEEGSGILLYLAQEGRGIGLMNKLRAYALQDQGFDTMEANERLGFEADERVFTLAAAMLRALGVKAVRLLTNNPEKVKALGDLGVPVTERVPHAFPPNTHNRRYLETKAKKGGHAL